LKIDEQTETIRIKKRQNCLTDKSGRH